MNSPNMYTNKQEKASSTDTHTVTLSLDLSNFKLLTPSQRVQLNVLSNLSDDAVRKEAENDQDCEPLE